MRVRVRALARVFVRHQHLGTYHVLPLPRSHSVLLAAVYSRR